jgi:DNA repair protein RecO (recombination protein O)
MNQLVTMAIVLARTDYGEADRIITLLSRDYGKIRVMARGVRKSKSRLAGGIELFSVSEVTFIKGRGEIDTLVSTRLKDHFGNLVKDLKRMQAAYEVLKLINKISEQHTDEQYFTLCEDMLAALNNATLPLEAAEVWFAARLQAILGREPNTHTDAAGAPLREDGTYQFSYDDMAFYASPHGAFGAQHIKLLRLLAHITTEQTLRIKDIERLSVQLKPLTQTLLQQIV